MNLYKLVLPLIVVVVCASSVIGKNSERVWYWFVSCDSLDMTLEVQLDEMTISKSTFPICHAFRDSIPAENQQKKVIFSFRPKRKIVWSGYRDEDDETKAGELIRGSIWQAGADPGYLVIGVAFFSSERILMNTLHIAYPSKRESSEIAKGLVVTTYPSNPSYALTIY